MLTKTARLSLIAIVVFGLAMAWVGSASAILSGGSTFKSGDGNLAVNTAGNHDWNTPVEPITLPWHPTPGTSAPTAVSTL